MNEVKLKLSQSEGKVVTKIIQSGEDFKVICLGLNKGAVLRKHKAPGRAKLIVIEGVVSYQANGAKIIMSPYKEYNIPLEEYHAVEGIQESVCLLIVG